MPPTKVIIVEDQLIWQDKIAAALTSTEDYQIVGSFMEKSSAITWLGSNVFLDLCLCDIGLPDGSGVDVIKVCRKHFPLCQILVISGINESRTVIEAIEAGADGYIEKQYDALDISRAIEDIKNGGSPMSPIIARQILKRLQGKEPVPEQSVNIQKQLSPREQQVLEYIIRGYTYKEIARLLDLSISTIETFIKHIYQKLGVHSRSEAAFAIHKIQKN